MSMSIFYLVDTFPVQHLHSLRRPGAEDVDLSPLTVHSICIYILTQRSYRLPWQQSDSAGQGITQHNQQSVLTFGLGPVKLLIS